MHNRPVNSAHDRNSHALSLDSVQVNTAVGLNSAVSSVESVPAHSNLGQNSPLFSMESVRTNSTHGQNSSGSSRLRSIDSIQSADLPQGDAGTRRLTATPTPATATARYSVDSVDANSTQGQNSSGSSRLRSIDSIQSADLPQGDAGSGRLTTTPTPATATAGYSVESVDANSTQDRNSSASSGVTSIDSIQSAVTGWPTATPTPTTAITTRNHDNYW